jgi:predicted secreted protein
MAGGVFNGDLMIIKVGSEQVAELTNCELTMTTNMFEITSKESGGKKEILAGNSEWSATADFNVDFVSSGKYDMADLVAAWDAKTALSITVTNGVTGDKQFAGTAFIDNVTYTGPQGDKASGTVSFAGTGALTITTIV